MAMIVKLRGYLEDTQMPNASVSMTIASHSDEDAETYEVLQSQSLEKQLALTKMKRRF